MNEGRKNNYDGRLLREVLWWTFLFALAVFLAYCLVAHLVWGIE